jgi:N-acetylmuramoyl-L-alanine amidase
MDNKSEVEFLLSDAGKEAVADLHVNGIINYCND